MTAPYPIRKACPVCGKPMKVVPEDQMGRERYVCTRCEHDPLQDPAIRKWTDGPLRPPAKQSGPLEHYPGNAFDSRDHRPPFEYGACSG